MVKRRRKGTTLIELLTVMTIFSVLMTLILGFYIYAYRVSGSRDRLSVSYRKMITIMDKVETMLANSRVIYASDTQVVFTGMNATQPILKGGWPNWLPPTTLVVVPVAKSSGGGYHLIARTGDGKSSIVGEVNTGEAITFGSSGGLSAGTGYTTTNTTSTNNTAIGSGVISTAPDSVNMAVTVQVLPENGVGIPRSYTLTRNILLERT